jgi:hypothetical protein
MTPEQTARNMLERMGVDNAQSFTAGDLIELTNLIAQRDALKETVQALHDEYCSNYPDGESALVDLARNELTDFNPQNKWEFTKDPELPGWYSVLICYDAQEGFFPSSGYWDGVKWDRKAVSGHGDRCESKEMAEAVAYKNDPDV